MAVAVVVAFEEVHIEDHQRQWLPVAAGLAPVLLQFLIELQPIGYAGQPVEHGLGAQQVVLHLQGQVGLHPCANDGRVDRFGDEVHRTQAEADQFVGFLALRSDEDHRNVAGLRVRLQAATDLVAVHALHDHVEQYQVGLLRLADGDRLGSAGCHEHFALVAK